MLHLFPSLQHPEHCPAFFPLKSGGEKGGRRDSIHTFECAILSSSNTTRRLARFLLTVKRYFQFLELALAFDKHSIRTHLSTTSYIFAEMGPIELKLCIYALVGIIVVSSREEKKIKKECRVGVDCTMHLHPHLN